MAGMRMSMRKIREVLRLTHELGLSVRQVREATGVGKTAVCEYVNRARVIGITWPIPPEISDAELELRLFTAAGFHEGPTKPLPDWTKVHEELKRRGVTLMILWEEHRAEHVDGHGYSRFCELYGEWRKRLSPTMRQTHVAGDKLFVDWAGDTVPVIDPMTGEVHEAHLFVAALGASSYTLRRGALERGAAGLDRCARQRARLHRRCAEGCGARQSQGRDHEAVALRAGRQQDVSGSRRSLRLRRAAGARPTPARQGQGGGRRRHRLALRARQAAQPALLLLGRAERRRWRLRQEDQREGDEAARAEPQRSLRQSRPAGAERASERSLPICRVEALHGRARLSRRGRRPLLLGAVRAGARDR